jgi:hypothetical protein
MLRSTVGGAARLLMLVVAGALAGALCASVALNAIGAPAGSPTPAVAQSNCLNGPGNGAYVALAAHRADVLQFYAKNGWDASSQCRQIFDNWVAQGPDGLPAMTAGQYAWVKGWLTANGEVRG